MLSKNQIKFINSLQQKKFREEHGLFVAEGKKLISELLDSSVTVKEIYGVESALNQLKQITGVIYTTIHTKELERISSLVTPNELLAVCKMPDYHFNYEYLNNKLTLILDTIKDPGNLGTIIRIADWFGIENIICSKETADMYNPKVVQATMGSIARVKLYYLNLEDFFNLNQQQPLPLPVYGALLQGESIYKSKLAKSGFILIGNESNGISENLIPFISHKITIPSFSYLKSSAQAETESLNAAIATAIFCSEFRRFIHS